MTCLLAQSSTNSSSGGEIILLVFWLAIAVVVVAGMWKMLEKANQPGWGVLIPIYNVILLLRVAGKPVWWLVLFLIPIVSIIPAILVPLAIAKNFGKSALFGLGLVFLAPIFYPILGFGSAEYCPSDVPEMSAVS